MDKKGLLSIVLLVALTAIGIFIGTKWDAAVNAQLDYQIKLKVSYDQNVKDSISVFDGSRKVGTVPLTYGEPFAELILSDNEDK